MRIFRLRRKLKTIPEMYTHPRRHRIHGPSKGTHQLRPVCRRMLRFIYTFTLVYRECYTHLKE